MEVIYKNENMGRCYKGTNSVDTVICIRRINGCLEGKYSEDLKAGLLEYETAGEFLAEMKKEFRGEDEETVKNS